MKAKKKPLEDDEARRARRRRGAAAEDAQGGGAGEAQGAACKVADVTELVDKLKNEAKVI